MKDNTSGVCRKSGTEFFMSDNPKKRSEKPTMSSEIFRLLSFWEIDKINPNAIKGIAKIDMSALNPNHETSHAVTVVPILAPMITLIPCTKVSKPALTNETTITVVALDDWMTVVIPKPVNTPRKGFAVIAERRLRNLSPAAFWRPELIKFIP